MPIENYLVDPPQPGGKEFRALVDVNDILWPSGVMSWVENLGTPNASTMRHVSTAYPLPITVVGTPAVTLSGNPAVTISGTVAVTGPLTDAQLRATAVNVLGPLTDAELRATPVPISGALTDAQLRASAVAVSGTVSAGQTGVWSVRTQDGVGNALVSSTSDPAGSDRGLITRNIPSGTQAVSAASLPLPTGAATETTLAEINTAQGAKGDTAASSGTGSFSVVALLKGALNALSGILGINLSQYNGSSVGTANAIHVQPGTGASFGVNDNGGSLTVDGAVNATITGGSVAVSGVITLDAATNAGAAVRTADYDTTGATVTTTMFGIALPSATGPIPGGTSSSPIRVDPTGTTTQPVAGVTAHDAPATENPLFIGGYASATQPPNVSAAGDKVRAWYTIYGAQNTNLVGDVVQADTNSSGTKTVLVSGMESSGNHYALPISSNYLALGGHNSYLQVQQTYIDPVIDERGGAQFGRFASIGGYDLFIPVANLTNAGGTEIGVSGTPLIVANDAYGTGSGTISALNGTVEAAFSGTQPSVYTSVVFELSGTFNVSIVAEIKVQAEWIQVPSKLIQNGNCTTATAHGLATPGLIQFNTLGAAEFRIRAQAYTSGPVTVRYSAGIDNYGTAIENVPSVTVSGTPSVSISGTPSVSISGTASISGTVTRNIDTGRTNLIYYATAAAAGATGVETAITLTRAADTGATTSAASFVVTAGKKFRITSITFATRGHNTATAQVTTFRIRINAAGAVTTGSTPIVLQARCATPATANSWDRFSMPIPEGYEIAGDGTLQFGVTANATFVSNAPTWDVIIEGYEY